MKYVTNHLGYWLRKIKEKHPETYNIIPLPTRVLLSVQHMVIGRHDLLEQSDEPLGRRSIFKIGDGKEKIAYTYEPKWEYIGIEFRSTDGDQKSLAFDMKKLSTP